MSTLHSRGSCSLCVWVWGCVGVLWVQSASAVVVVVFCLIKAHDTWCPHFTWTGGSGSRSGSGPLPPGGGRACS